MISRSPVNTRRQEALQNLTMTNIPTIQIITEDPLIDLSEDGSSTPTSDRPYTSSQLDGAKRKRKNSDHAGDVNAISAIKNNIRAILFDEKSKFSKLAIAALLGEFAKLEGIVTNVQLIVASLEGQLIAYQQMNNSPEFMDIDTPRSEPPPANNLIIIKNKDKTGPQLNIQQIKELVTETLKNDIS